MPGAVSKVQDSARRPLLPGSKGLASLFQGVKQSTEQYPGGKKDERVASVRCCWAGAHHERWEEGRLGKKKWKRV